MADAGFDDDFIYRELQQSPGDRSIPMIPMYREKARDLFDHWKRKENKIKY